MDQNQLRRYNKHMKKSSKQSKKRIETTTPQAMRLVLAGYLLVLLVLQLFTFEQFPELVATAGVGGVYSYIVAIALVVVELMALPYLISMKVPTRLQKLSLVSLILAMVGLSVLEVSAYLSGQTVVFGATFGLPGGSWSLLFMAALWVLAFWGVFGNRLVGEGKKQATA